MNFNCVYIGTLRKRGVKLANNALGFMIKRDICFYHFPSVTRTTRKTGICVQYVPECVYIQLCKFVRVYRDSWKNMGETVYARITHPEVAFLLQG